MVLKFAQSLIMQADLSWNLTFPPYSDQFQKGRISELRHKCEESPKTRSFSTLCNVAKVGQVVKGEILGELTVYPIKYGKLNTIFEEIPRCFSRALC